MARRVGFLEAIPEGVELHSLSLCGGGAWQYRGAPSGLPSEMSFEGHTCFLLNKSVKSQVSVGSKQACTRAVYSGFFTKHLRDKQAHLYSFLN